MPRRRHPHPPQVDTTSGADLSDLADVDSDGGGGSGRHPQRNAANARERARMRVLSRAFCRLKTTLPWVPADTKLSKLDTLRLATSYIAHLRAVLTDQPLNMDAGQKHPLSLTWPFTFQQSGSAVNNNCDSGGCWTNSSRDSEDEEYHNSTIIQQNQNMSNGQGVIREYSPYYQQYTDSLMHIG